MEKENQNLKDLLKLHEIMDGKDPNDDFGDSETCLEKIDFEKARMIKELIDYKSISDTSTQCQLSFVQDLNNLTENTHKPKLMCSSRLSSNSAMSLNCEFNCRASLPNSSLDSLDELFEPVCKSHI